MIERAKKVKLLLCDVDGVLTDGTIAIDDDGKEQKFFNVKDGHGIKLLQRAGIEVGIISGRFSQATFHRARELSINLVFIGVKNKLEAFEEVLKETGLEPSEIGYIGDDVVDIPVMRRVGFPVAVGDGVEEVKREAVYVTRLPGGKGAVREVAEIILKSKGLWEEVLKRYYS